MEFKSSLLYPEIKVEEKNIEYAKILLNLYSGRDSEETIFHTFFYQSLILDNEYKNILKQISDVELIHLEILGKTIKLLGIEPMFIFPNNIDNGFKIWNSSFINYEKTDEKLILYDIQNKENIIKEYKEAYEKINDKYIKSIINRILLDEEIHVSIFKEIYGKIKVSTQNLQK